MTPDGLCASIRGESGIGTLLATATNPTIVVGCYAEAQYLPGCVHNFHLWTRSFCLLLRGHSRQQGVLGTLTLDRRHLALMYPGGGIDRRVVEKGNAERTPDADNIPTVKGSIQTGVQLGRP